MTMPTSVNQKEYLKKYISLNKGSEKPKKKKKKSANKKMGFNIVSESNDLNDIPFGFGDDDDAPTIAEITYDDRQTKLKEQFNANSHKWKNITEPESNDFSISIQKTQDDKVKVDSKGFPYRKRHDSDDSPVRKREQDLNTVSLGTKNNILNSSPPRRKRHDSDTSPPRRKRHDSDASPPRRKGRDSDVSPPRRKRHDSDASPPRKQRHDSDASPPRRKRHDSDASPPRLPPNHADVPSMDQSTTEDIPIRPEKTMSTQEFLRARKQGRLKKDTPEDLARQKREEALQRTAGEKYTRWNRGVVQTAVAQQAAAHTLHEMGKAFSRNADDTDMNTHLKQTVRMEDPMLEYIARKQAKDDATTGRLTRPVYKGAFPPNRLNIRPGHRWDGVDRSSGYEKEWFARQNAKRAVDEESYKWSTEDM